MADSTQDTSSLDCIPEIYLERRSAQSTHHSHHGRVQPRGEGVDEKGKQPTAGESNDDLVKEGFIPYNELKLHHLPEAIRTQKNLDRILSIGERVVCVNNNQLSEERNVEEEMKMPGVVLKGTGFIVNIFSNSDYECVTLFTNRHVLYNNEEILKSTIDFNFDSYRGSQQVREMERTKRGNGRQAFRQNSKVDFCIAAFDLDCKSKTTFQWIKVVNEPLLYRSWQSAATSEESLGKGIVCVISHPLGHWKHVSFGEIVTCLPQNNTFLHNAPTKPGSSGAPIIVFGGSALQVPQESLFYHEGVDHKRNLKIGHVEVDFGSVRLPCLFSCDQSDLIIKKQHARVMQLLDSFSFYEVRQKAQADTRSLRLCAFFPIFAAFILHPEKYCSRVITLPSAPPCQSLSKCDVKLSAKEKGCMTSCLSRWVHFKSSLFPPPMSQSAEPGADLSPLLTTEAPCWCQAIVEAVVHTSRSDKDTGVFLRPDAVCGDFRQDPRWPWSLDRCGGICGPGREPMLKHCLLKECLDVFRGAILRCEEPLRLLMLIRTANAIVTQTSSQTPQAQHRCYGFTRTTSVTSAHTKSDDQRPEVAPTENMSSADLKQLRVVADVFSILEETARKVTDMSWWVQITIVSSLTEKCKPNDPEDECVKTFYTALAVICHLIHHNYYDHPDSPASQEVPPPRLRCECGRPSLTDVTKAACTLCSISTNELESRLAARGEKIEFRPEYPLPDESCSNPNQTEIPSFETLLAKSMFDCTSTHGVPYPLEQFLSCIDSLDNFRNSCDLISVFLTSLEVFLFNTRNLLRQYRHHLFLSPVYISAPVSVFPRPGRWAGGHTPEEVKNTAWKLVQAACTESRFGRECLEVLERDTARREKLIDLYVDIKQLKFSGDIEEENMTAEYMAFVYNQEREQEEILSVLESVDCDPTYFVMKTFLKLFPIPSWDREWEMMQRRAQR